MPKKHAKHIWAIGQRVVVSDQTPRGKISKLWDSNQILSRPTPRKKYLNWFDQAKNLDLRKSTQRDGAELRPGEWPSRKLKNLAHWSHVRVVLGQKKILKWSREIITFTVNQRTENTIGKIRGWKGSIN